MPPGRPDPPARAPARGDDLHHRPGWLVVRAGARPPRSTTCGSTPQAFNGNPSEIVYDWNSVEEYLARFDRQVAINVAYLIPNGNVRMEVMGHDPRMATDDDLKAMQRLVREGMDAGAVGALDRPRLPPQQVRRCPRDCRPLRGSRPPTMGSMSRT